MSVFSIFCTYTSFAQNTLSRAELQKVSTKTNFNLWYENQTVSTELKSYINNWKLSFWNKTKQKTNNKPIKYSFGGGIESPYITLGSIYLYGDAKVFQDFSSYYAWSSLFFQRHRWIIKSPATSIPLGLRVGYKFFDIWFRVSDVSKIDTISYATGMRLGYKIGFYEPQFFYEYNARNLVNYKFISDSWYLNNAMASSLHSFALIQKIDIQHLFLNCVIKLSESDTTSPALQGTFFMMLDFPFINIKTQVQVSHNYFITSDLKYPKKTWSHSTQIKVPYSKLSFVQARYALWMNNPLIDYNFVSPHKSSTYKEIQMQYALLWRHAFVDFKKFYHQLDLEYVFNSSKTQHSNTVSYAFKNSLWKTEVQVKNYWYYHTSTLEFIRTQLQLFNSLERGIFDEKIKVFVNTKFFLLPYDIKKTTQYFDEFNLAFGIKAFVQSFYITVTVPYVHNIRKKSDVSLKFALKYYW